MVRKALIEQILRQVYGTFPTDDATITDNLVNQMINQGIGLAVKQQYKDAVQLDGVGYVNNSFYTTFKGLAISKDENTLWKVTLPDVPLAVGRNEGVSVLRVKDEKGKLSKPLIWISESQVGYYESLPTPQFQTLAYYNGANVYIVTTLDLSSCTANATIVSGGDSTDLTSTLNVPADYMPIIVEYVTKQLMMARGQVQDTANDGSDAVRST